MLAMTTIYGKEHCLQAEEACKHSLMALPSLRLMQQQSDSVQTAPPF